MILGLVNLVDERGCGGGEIISGGVDRGIHALDYLTYVVAVASRYLPQDVKF